MISLTTLQQDALNVATDEVLHLCYLYEIHRTDGFVVYITDHDGPLLVGGKTYSPTSGIQTGALQKKVGVQSRNRVINAVVGDGLISPADLAAEKYQNAQVVEMLIDWTLISNGVYLTNKYWIDDITFTNEEIQANIIGISDWLKNQYGYYCYRGCRWKLGRGQCQANVSGMSLTGSVVSVVTPNTTFIVTANPVTDFSSQGILTWTSGANNGLQTEIKSQVHGSSNSTIILWLATPYTITPGDTFTMEPGCNHQTSDCLNKFNQIANYGGFPNMPGTDVVYQSPNA